MKSISNSGKIKKYHFASMVLSYFLGVFVDNFFKQAAMLIALSAGMKGVQGIVTVVFTMPYLLVTSYGGWFADRFPKRHVVIWSKIFELGAVIFGAVGLYMVNESDSLLSISWTLIFTMMGIMGLQSAIFSPALNGSIPEIFSESKIMYVNSVIKLTVTVSILTGIGFAGVALDAKPFGFITKVLPVVDYQNFPRILIGVILFATAFFGIIFSLFIKSGNSASKSAPFPWYGPIDAVKQVILLRKDHTLNLVVWSDAFFWFVGAVQILLINELGKSQFGFSNTMTSVLVVSQLMGIAGGAFVISTLTRGKSWDCLLVLSLSLMAVFMGAMFFAPFIPEIGILGISAKKLSLVIILAAIGLFGGMFLIPIESFIQIRPKPDEKGKVISCANFTVMGAVMMSGPAYWLLARFNLKPTTGFAILALFTIFIAFYVSFKLKQARIRK